VISEKELTSLLVKTTSPKSVGEQTKTAKFMSPAF
jgi:hypothetical protein